MGLTGRLNCSMSHKLLVEGQGIHFLVVTTRPFFLPPVTLHITLPYVFVKLWCHTGIAYCHCASYVFYKWEKIFNSPCAIHLSTFSWRCNRIVNDQWLGWSEWGNYLRCLLGRWKKWLQLAVMIAHKPEVTTALVPQVLGCIPTLLLITVKVGEGGLITETCPYIQTYMEIMYVNFHFICHWTALMCYN